MRQRLFILDDDQALTRLMSWLFQDNGDECVVASSLQEMKDQKQAVLTTDIVLLDINLGPGQPSGLDAFRWLKSVGYQGRTLFFTGYASSGGIVEEVARVSGTRVVKKPTSLEELVSVVHGSG